MQLKRCHLPEAQQKDELTFAIHTSTHAPIHFRSPFRSPHRIAHLPDRRYISVQRCFGRARDNG